MKKIYLNRLIIFLLLSLVFSIGCSCSKSQETQPSDAGGEGAAALKSAEPGNGKDKDETSSGRSAAASVSEPEGNDFLLFSDIRKEPVIAEDFDIGLLQAGFGDDGITADILKTAEKFLQGLEAGMVDSSLIGSDKKSFVERMMREGLEVSIPEDFRIGGINTVDGQVWAKIKMYGQDGSAAGTMYFIREGGWKIYDFHFDFEDLKQMIQTKPDLWDPSDIKKIEVEHGKYN